jgi:hypothetical protein
VMTRGQSPGLSCGTFKLGCNRPTAPGIIPKSRMSAGCPPMLALAGACCQVGPVNIHDRSRRHRRRGADVNHDPSAVDLRCRRDAGAGQRHALGTAWETVADGERAAAPSCNGRLEGDVLHTGRGSSSAMSRSKLSLAGCGWRNSRPVPPVPRRSPAWRRPHQSAPPLLFLASGAARSRAATLLPSRVSQK